MDYTYSLVGLIRIIIKRWAFIAIFIGLAAIGSVIAVLLMPEYFESRSVFYPTNLAITDRQMLFKKEGGDNIIDYFGSKNDVNRVLSIAQSSPIKDFMINHFRLYEHYDIDTTSKHWRYKVKEEFEDNYSAVKTELGAIEIGIMDQDPQMAANMVNQLVEVIDKHNKMMVTENKGKIVEVFRIKLEEKRDEVSALADSLSGLKSKYGIEVSVSSDGDNRIITGRDYLGVEMYKVLDRQQQNALLDLSGLATLYEQYEVAAREDVSSLYILEKAYPADRKSKPIRWLICVSVTLIAAFLAIVGVIMAEQVRALRYELKNG